MQFQQLVGGGLFALVTELHNGDHLYANEEFLNLYASGDSRFQFGFRIPAFTANDFGPDFVCGPAFIVGPEVGGRPTSPKTTAVDLIRRLQFLKFKARPPELSV